jgi:hypothetical protein
MSVHQYLSTQLFPPRVLYGVPRRRLSRLHHAGTGLRISSATVTRAGSQARDPRPSEGFLEGFLAASLDGGKEERAARRIGEPRVHELNRYPAFPTSKRSVSMLLKYFIRLQRRGNYGQRVLRLLREQASWTSFLSHMWTDKHLRAKRQPSSN